MRGCANRCCKPSNPSQHSPLVSGTALSVPFLGNQEALMHPNHQFEQSLCTCTRESVCEQPVDSDDRFTVAITFFQSPGNIRQQLKREHVIVLTSPLLFNICSDVAWAHES